MEIHPKTIHKKLATAWGPSSPSYTIVTRWVKRFREGRKDVNDDPQSSSSLSEFTVEDIELVRQVISNDPHSTYDEIITGTSLSLSLSHSTIERIIHDWLKMKKVTSRCVSHQLTDEQKQQRVKLCRENVAKFQNGSWRLRDIITGDETWIYDRQIHHKSKNASWLAEGKPPTAAVRRSKFEAKNLFSIFFKSNGPILIHYIDEGKTIDHNYYIEKCLKPVVKEMWKQRS